MTHTPKVSVILLNWNQYALTAACINSLKQCTYPNIEIVVVDQASHDNSVALLKEHYPDVTLIQNAKNTGFTGGNNQGMSAATGDYFLLLNNDTEVNPSFLEPLVEALESDVTAAAASPLIRFFFTPSFIQYAGGPASIDLIRGRNVWRGWQTQLPHSYSSVEKTTAAHGAAFMIKRSIVEKIGMLDEKLFIYYEEYDWSLRIREAGFSILFVPRSEILHKESMTLTKDSPFRTKLMARNRLWLSKKYLPFYKHFLSVSYVWFCSMPLNIIRYALRNKFDLAKALFAGSVEGTF